jgi:hypothetical protein
MRAFFAITAILLIVGICPAPAEAQPVPTRDSSSTHIFPAGAQRGSTVAVRVGAECIAPGTRLLVEGQGVSPGDSELRQRLPSRGEPSPRRKPTEVPITYPKEWAAELRVAADAPLGTAYWRVHSAQGGTGSRPFIIGDLPEFVETESNSAPELAENVAVPVTINGQISGERDADYFRFHVRAGQWIVLETVCRRLGSRLDPVLDISRDDGQLQPVEKMYLGEDPVLAFQAPQDGQYLLRIANISFHGDPAHVYRINVTGKPLPRLVVPSSGKPGTEADFTIAAFPQAMMPEPARVGVRVPSDAAGEFRWENDLFSTPVSILVDDLDVVGETETSDGALPASLAWPVIVDARMDWPADIDQFPLSVRAGDRLSIECRAWPRTSGVIPVVSLRGEQTELGRAQSIDAADGVCRIDWVATADETVSLLVSDLGSQHGALAGYRLRIDRGRPDFSLSLASDQFDVVQGANAELTVNTTRFGGFDGEIELLVDGLPEGVTMGEAKIPAGQPQTKITLTATSEARSATCVLHVRGRATLDGRTVERVARSRHLGRDGEGNAYAGETLDRLHLSVRHAPVFRLFCGEAYQYAHRGTIYPYLMEIERLNGFDAPITLQLGDRQNRDLDGIEMLEVTFPAGQSQVLLPILLPETMHINIQSQSQIYCQGYASFTDAHGERQSVLVVSEKRNMLRTLPPVAKLEAMQPQIAAAAGSRATCRLRLERTSNFTGPVTIELVEPPGGVVAAPCTIPAGENEALATIEFPAQTVGEPPHALRFRACGDMAGGAQFVSEAEIAIRWTSER